jgi:hypothetical protein
MQIINTHTLLSSKATSGNLSYVTCIISFVMALFKAEKLRSLNASQWVGG